jgi:hypothetical protein
MIRFKLSKNDSSAVWVTSSAQSRVRFLQGRLCRDHEDHPFASLQGREWQFDSEGFEDVIFEDAVMVVFSDDAQVRGPCLGPFEDFHTVDGEAYAEGRLLAAFDRDAGRWREISTGNSWTTLTVVAAEPPRRRDPHNVS